MGCGDDGWVGAAEKSQARYEKEFIARFHLPRCCTRGEGRKLSETAHEAFLFGLFFYGEIKMFCVQISVSFLRRNTQRKN